MSKGLDRQLPADTPEQVGARAKESTDRLQRSVSAHKCVSYTHTMVAGHTGQRLGAITERCMGQRTSTGLL